MSALEQEIINRISKLDESQQRAVLSFLERLNPAPFDSKKWLEEVQAFRQYQKKKYSQRKLGIQDLLDEVREENS